MLQIKQAIIVEGKYDKIKLASLVKAVIIQTNGFQIYKNQELLELIRYYARTTGIIILTDSDRAGFQIRNYIKGAVSEGNIKNIYIPDIFGKEKRKIKQSAEGKLGVEGIDAKILREAFQKAGVLTEEKISGEV
ncbi:MAG: toprim domain-containing protein, partial [Oscillospiraceae bacterium]|nr:toprim domain-containing protein [Oscillospiraceae bacterium]